MQIQQKKKNPFDLLGGIICLCADTFPDWYKWVRSFTFQCKMPGCSRLQGGGVGGRVNFKPPLSIVGCVSAWFGKSPCKLCIQGFSVHVHKNTNFFITAPLLCRVFMSTSNETRNEMIKLMLASFAAWHSAHAWWWWWFQTWCISAFIAEKLCINQMFYLKCKRTALD